MINVSLDSDTIWAKKSSRFFITVRNSGPEDLYCGDEEFEPSGKGSYIIVSSLNITPQIGDMEEALVANREDIAFEVAEQPESGRHYQLWVCIYSNGILKVKPNEGIACLPKKSCLRIQADIKGTDITGGLGLLNYRFRDWQIFDTVKSEYIKQDKEAKELWVTKMSAPSIEFAPKTSYSYGEETVVAWKIKGVGEDMGEISVAINGQIQSLKDSREDFYEGELPLFMKDESYVLEFRSEYISRGLRKKFWPAWFEMRKIPSPEKKIPGKDSLITLWWNIPEAQRCKVQGMEKPALDQTEDFLIDSDKTDFTLSYYDEENYEKEMKILYKAPCINEFTFAGRNILTGEINNNMSGFADPEKISRMDAAVNAVYGGDMPDPPSPPVVYEDLRVHVKCEQGDCYFSVNKGKIWTVSKEEQGNGKNISVVKSGQYSLELWDCYGCKVKGELKH